MEQANEFLLLHNLLVFQTKKVHVSKEHHLIESAAHNRRSCKEALLQMERIVTSLNECPPLGLWKKHY
jgi:hypothetical protein